MLSPNVVIPFDGLHANIPAGFARETNFDGKFPKGVSTGFGTTGGSDTHTHTAAHTHTVATHLHYTTTSGVRNNSSSDDMGVNGGVANDSHQHNGTWYSATMGTEASASTSASLTTSTLNSVPPFYEVIFIKSTGYNFIPVNGMVYHSGNRTGLTYHTASENRYLRGAATGANAGTTGGGTSHSHTQSHSHTANSHSHTNVQTKMEPPSGEDGQSSPAKTHDHTHTIYVANGTQGMNTNTTSSSTTSSIEPVYKTLKHYKATALTLPQPGDIAITTETIIPVGWIACDGTGGTPDLQDFFIKNTTSAGSTGGSNTHTHTLSHYHTGSGTHTHTPNYDSDYSGTSGGHTGSGKRGVSSHRHQEITVDNMTVDYNTSAPTSSADNNEPAYIKVRYIQLKFIPISVALLALL